MKKDRIRKTEYLFREIGGIDDRYLDEALSYRPRRAASFRVAMIAACLSLCCVLLLVMPLIARLSNKTGDSPDGMSPNGQAPELLYDLFFSEYRDVGNSESITGSAYTVLASKQALNFFSGDVRVVWQYRDSSALYVSRALTAAEESRLRESIQNGTSVGESGAQPECMVWIVYGNGTVISPYLPITSGNADACNLFDYNAEVIPSSDFTSCLSEILQ